jgi:hypothetical protein
MCMLPTGNAALAMHFSWPFVSPVAFRLLQCCLQVTLRLPLPVMLPTAIVATLAIGFVSTPLSIAIFWLRCCLQLLVLRLLILKLPTAVGAALAILGWFQCCLQLSVPRLLIRMLFVGILLLVLVLQCCCLPLLFDGGGLQVTLGLPSHSCDLSGGHHPSSHYH